MPNLDDAIRLTVANKDLTCVVCKNDTFIKKKFALTNPTVGYNFFSAMFAPTAVTYTCTTCGYIHWFNPEMMS